jgi:hypothetical protein
MTALMNQLEDCINFVVSIGGSAVKGLSGDMLVSTYARDVLLLGDLWDAVSTQTINHHVRLCHLQSLFLSLEEKMHGSALDGVFTKYRERLPQDLLEALLSGLAQLDLPLLLPILRDFVAQELVKDTWSADESLKTYLEFSSEVPLDELEWFQVSFPVSIQLRHALHTYQTLFDTSSQKSSS